MVLSIMQEAIFIDFLRQKLIAEFPDIDEETLRDTLAGASNLEEHLAELIRRQLEDGVLLDALKCRLQDMQLRCARLENRIDKIRDLVCSVMSRAHLTKIVQPDFTVSLRAAGPKLVVVNEAEIPSEYWVPQSPRLDRQRLLSDLKATQPVPGAILEAGGSTISIRTK